MKNLWSKRWVRVTSILLLVFVTLFLMRGTLLRGIGSWLDSGDPSMKTDACFVLGGNSFERGLAAVNLYLQFPDQKFVATGGNYPSQILCLDTMMTEAELTRHWMLSKGVPASQVDTLASSHSTMEESDEILSYCKANNMKHITVISSGFHIRRVRWVFQDKFEDAGIKINFHGAESLEYNSQNWWKNEEGLIMTNNEIVKLVYYLIKY